MLYLLGLLGHHTVQFILFHFLSWVPIIRKLNVPHFYHTQILSSFCKAIQQIDNHVSSRLYETSYPALNTVFFIQKEDQLHNLWQRFLSKAFNVRLADVLS